MCDTRVACQSIDSVENGATSDTVDVGDEVVLSLADALVRVEQVVVELKTEPADPAPLLNELTALTKTRSQPLEGKPLKLRLLDLGIVDLLLKLSDHHNDDTIVAVFEVVARLGYNCFAGADACEPFAAVILEHTLACEETIPSAQVPVFVAVWKALHNLIKSELVRKHFCSEEWLVHVFNLLRHGLHTADEDAKKFVNHMLISTLFLLLGFPDSGDMALTMPAVMQAAEHLPDDIYEGFRSAALKAMVLGSHEDYDPDLDLNSMGCCDFCEFVTERLRQALDGESEKPAVSLRPNAPAVFWSVYQVVFVLARLAMNSKLQSRLRETGAIALLKRTLGRPGDTPNPESHPSEFAYRLQGVTAGLWNLAFDHENALLVKQDVELMTTLEHLAKHGDQRTATNATGALFQLGLAERCTGKCTSDEHQHEAPQSLVMVSYSWKDQDIAHWLWKTLEARGFKVWIDVADLAGSTLEAMADAVERSNVVVTILSEHYKDSSACRTEAEYAYQLHKPIVPIKREETGVPLYEPTGWLGALMGSKLWFKFNMELVDTPEFTAFDGFLKAIKAYVPQDQGGDGPSQPREEQTELRRLRRHQTEAESVIRNLQQQLQTPQPEVVPTSMCEGWVIKCAVRPSLGTLRKWRRRYLVLSSDGTLAYYENQSAALPKGVVFVRSATTTILHGEACNWARPPKKAAVSCRTTVRTPTGDLLFYTEDCDATQHWARALAELQSPAQQLAAAGTGPGSAALRRATTVLQAVRSPVACAAESKSLEAMMLKQLAAMEQRLNARLDALETKLDALAKPSCS
eukprot:m.71690 g.71690  ORF g.71690 m.71690 type:complete len:803 (-) comp14202_c0_seq1:188-2596(-)